MTYYNTALDLHAHIFFGFPLVLLHRTSDIWLGPARPQVSIQVHRELVRQCGMNKVPSGTPVSSRVHLELPPSCKSHNFANNVHVCASTVLCPFGSRVTCYRNVLRMHRTLSQQKRPSMVPAPLARIILWASIPRHGLQKPFYR